jgi:hypothetical protein
VGGGVHTALHAAGGGVRAAGDRRAGALGPIGRLSAGWFGRRGRQCRRERNGCQQGDPGGGVSGVHGRIFRRRPRGACRTPTHPRAGARRRALRGRTQPLRRGSPVQAGVIGGAMV